MVLHHLEGTYKYPMAMKPIHFCAAHGLYLVSYRLLGDTITGIECKVEDGRRALHMAAENGHENMVQHLLSHGADTNAESADGRTPLQLALESGNESIAQLLIDGGADVNANFASGETPLSVVVGNRWAFLVHVLLHEKADPNGRLPDGRTSLHVAAEVGSDIGIITLLCDNGADPTLGDERSWTALHYAAHYGHREAASFLMGDRITRSVFERIGWTPLHAAIEQEHTEIVRLFTRFAKSVSYLLANQREGRQLASVSTSRSTFSKARGTAEDAGESSALGRRNSPPTASLMGERVPTPLFLATSQGYIAGIDALMEAGVASEDVKVCIQLAFTKGKVAVLERLVLDSEQHIKSLLSLSRKGSTGSGKSQITLELLFKSFQWNKDNILVAMKQAIRQSNQGLLLVLVEQFFLLDDKSRNQIAEQLMDVLQVAVECGDVEAVRLLQIAGVELSRPITAVLGQHESREISCTLLHQAAQFQNSDMGSYLLGSISPNITDARGRTPLHYAVEHKHAQRFIVTLLSSGADISSRDDQGWTPLHVASHYGVSASASSLLDAGAQVDVLDSADMTPLHHCAFSFPWSHQYPSPVMLLLLEAGASPTLLNKDRYTPLQLALITSIRTTSPRHLSSILDQQTDLISARLPPLDRTALYFAAEADCGSSILDELFVRKADLEAEDKDGKTPVQIAGKGAHRVLINRGAQWRE